MLTHLKQCRAPTLTDDKRETALLNRQREVETSKRQRTVPLSNHPTLHSTDSLTPEQSSPGLPLSSIPECSSPPHHAIDTQSVHGSGSGSPPSKRQRTEWQAIPAGEMQAEFAEDFMKLLVANGLAWLVAANPETLRFVGKWCPPQVHVPHRETLAGRILKDGVEKANARTAERVKGELATAQSDGWKDVAKTPVNTSMMTVNNEVSICRIDTKYREFD